MKVQASLVVGAVSILKALDLTQMKLSTAHKVRKLLNECQVSIEDFEARRITIAEKHGTLNEEGNKYDFEPEAAELFQAEMKEMMDDELDIAVDPIPFELLDDYVNVEPASFELVEWFISGLE